MAKQGRDPFEFFLDHTRVDYRQLTESQCFCGIRSGLRSEQRGFSKELAFSECRDDDLFIFTVRGDLNLAVCDDVDDGFSSESFRADNFAWRGRP